MTRISQPCKNAPWEIFLLRHLLTFQKDHLKLGSVENIANKKWGMCLIHCPKAAGQVKVKKRIGANPEQMFRTEI